MTPIPNDPRHVFDAANDFRIGSEMLESRFGQPVFPLRSTIVTAALSAELYLKCLLHLSGTAVPKRRDGHDLKILYNALDKAHQQKVESHFRGAQWDGGPLSNALDEIADAFVDWRYIYEEQANTFSFCFRPLRLLVQALDKTVRELKPEWK